MNFLGKKNFFQTVTVAGIMYSQLPVMETEAQYDSTDILIFLKFVVFTQ